MKEQLTKEPVDAKPKYRVFEDYDQMLREAARIQGERYRRENKVVLSDLAKPRIGSRVILKNSNRSSF